MTEKPKVSNSAADREVEKIGKQFDEFEKSVKDLTLDRMKEAPKEASQPLTQLSEREIANSKDIYLKPVKTMSSPDKFNEKYRDAYNYAKEYVCFIAENREAGDQIDIWTKPFSGVMAEEWIVPVGKPIWGPRYLAEQIKNCAYHRLKMNESAYTGENQYGSMYGQLVVDSTIQRLDAFRAKTNRKTSVFM